MSLRRPNPAQSTSKTFRNSIHAMPSSSLDPKSSTRLNHSQMDFGPSQSQVEEDSKTSQHKLHVLEMENQRLRLELQRRPTMKEHNDQQEEMEKVERLFAQGSQENEKLMTRMKGKEEREKELDRALSCMLGQDWPAQLGVAHTSPLAPSVDFELTPLPAQRFIRSNNFSLGQSMTHSLTGASPGTPVSQINHSRSRQPSLSFADSAVDSPLGPTRSAQTNGLSPDETQQLLRLLLAPSPETPQPTVIETGVAIEPELVRSFIEHLEDYREQLAEQEKRGSAREARIRSLIQQVQTQSLMQT